MQLLRLRDEIISPSTPRQRASLFIPFYKRGFGFPNLNFFWLRCTHPAYAASVWAPPGLLVRSGGRKKHCKHADAPAACWAVSNKPFVSDSGVLSLLPASREE